MSHPRAGHRRRTLSRRLRTLAAAVAATLLAGAGSVAAAAPVAPSTDAADPGNAVRPEGEKASWRLGPFLLPPAPAGTAPLNRPLLQLDKPCEDCFVTGIEFQLVYADGTPANMNTGVMLHHVGLYDPLHPDPASQPCSTGRPAFGSGDERAPWLVTPPGYGLPVTSSPWAGFAELMNHSNEMREVYLDADVYHVPASTPGIKPITPIMLSVADACEGFEYDVPAGRHARSLTWTSTVTGRLVWALGHVHAGGTGIALRNLTTGKRLCASHAGYGTAADDLQKDALANAVTSMSTCSWDSLGAIRKGDKLQLTSYYDSPRPLTGAMGLMNLGVYETSDLAGGTAPPARMHQLPPVRVPAGVADEHGDGHGGTGGHGH